MIDPIADMLNRIRNAQAVLKETVSVPFSNIKFEIAKILEKEGYLGKLEKKKRGELKFFEIILKYDKDENNKDVPAISSIKRISKSGQRVYKKKIELKPILGGYGIAVISTSKGMMTNKEARKKKLGGEIICEVW